MLGLGLSLTSRAALGSGVSIPRIVLSASSALDSASVGDDVGTASISGSTTGTASWSLSDDAGGKYSINSSTGLVEVAGALTAGIDIITISVSGLTPSVSDRSFTITVSDAPTNYTATYISQGIY